ncbi:MAG: hypothetical protein JKY56_04050 [Kofleriaceae bacterium]|nr:hypothetical protein [Kofleriaceae bacterium]
MMILKTATNVFAIGLLGALATGCSAPKQTGTQITEGDPVTDAKGYVMELAQGWTDDTQQHFYNTDQGSQVMPYEWILALEQASNQKRYLASANIERYRYLPREASTSTGNPDGLPVGWTKGESDGKHWLGFTCAACHSTQLEYTIEETKQKIMMRIDGAPSLADFSLMSNEMVSALGALVSDPDKFSRFATKVLGEDNNEANKAALLAEVKLRHDKLHTRNEINRVGSSIGKQDPAAEVYGFGRIDAIGFIINQVMATLPEMPENAKPSNAPVSYPFLWGTDQSSAVQWTGFAANASGIGTLVRNGGEVVGVFGSVALSSKDTYVSSLAIENLGTLENNVRELNSPPWPAKVFPEINSDKSGRGKTLFANNCASCHEVIDHKNAIKKAYVAVITPLADIKTDSGALLNINREYKAGIFAGKKEAAIVGDIIAASTGDMVAGLEPLINTVTGSLLHHPEESIKAEITEFATGTIRLESRKCIPAMPDGESCSGTVGYKSRPLNGIWATAPFLHNGSVPSLWELLLPVDKRSKTFILGSRVYDPVNVGFTMDQPIQADTYTPFVFDVSKLGNANTGHTYGTTLTETERWDLVEYMKSL